VKRQHRQIFAVLIDVLSFRMVDGELSGRDLDTNGACREQVFQLWDELAAIPSAETDRAWRHLATTISGWVQADMAYWCANVRFLHGEEAERDVLYGWRIKVINFLDPPIEAVQLAAQRHVDNRLKDPGMSTIAAVRGSGVFRVDRLHSGFVDMDAFSKTEYYQTHYVDFGIHDQLSIGCPISPEVEVFYVFNRRKIRDLFSEADAELAGFALRGLSWFHRQMVYSHGLLVAKDPLTPTQREVLRLLLSDKTEKEIAAELGQSFHTTHTHVKDIFRKYNVKSRAGLMAVWLA
jgi:DNA-binding CsgD family transcriptional regulator